MYEIFKKLAANVASGIVFALAVLLSDSSQTTDIYRKTNRGHGSQNQITQLIQSYR